MPTGTKVHRCVQKVKRGGAAANAYAVCQAATGQSYATGRKLPGKHKGKGRRRKAPVPGY